MSAALTAPRAIPFHIVGARPKTPEIVQIIEGFFEIVGHIDFLNIFSATSF